MNELKEGDVINGQIEFNTNRSAYVKIANSDREVYIYKKNTINSLHLDQVKVEIIKTGDKLEGQVIEVISRFKTEWVGTVQKTKTTVFVILDSPKITVDFYVPLDASMDAQDKQKVIVSLIKWKRGTKSPYAKIVRILGEKGDNNTEMNAIMHEYGLPVEFPKEVELEAENIPAEISTRDIESRRDMRNVTTFTIDPLDAKDFDDALSVNTDGEYTEIGVHIADVTHYVKPDSKLEEEAIKRATSVYLVDRCVSMLPERLSNGICSLRPNEDKLCFSVVFKLDIEGNIVDRWFGKTIIHSNRRFTYEEAQEIIEGKKGDHENEIKLLDRLAKKIRGRRITSGSLELDQVEVRFKLDDKGKPLDVYFKIQKDANKLIEEYMLLANQEVAKLLFDNAYHSVYRVHDKPNQVKLESLHNVAEAFGYTLDISDKDNIKTVLNELLADIKDSPEENLIGTLVTRTMAKATYTIKNIGHYGLGFTHYSHFTSPIRRYPDMMTHRLLNDFLSKIPKGNPVEIEQKAKWSSDRELVAAKAQRDSIKYKQAEFLQDKIGKVFNGVVSGVTDYGMYVELVENKCEGMIRFSDIEDDTYVADTANYKIVGHNTGRVIRLGDEIMVVITGVNLEKKQVNFKMFSL